MGAKDGEIYYDSTYGGFAIDTNPFPKSTCMNSYAAFASTAGLQAGHLALKGITNCLSDAQESAEVKRFADAQGWPHGPTTEFFMYTPHNVGSCFNPDGKTATQNLANVCAYDYYCAYHSSIGTTPSTEYIYSNMPWPNQAFSIQGGNQYRTDCDGGEHPNGTGSISNGTDPNGPTDQDAADEVIGVTSHEHNESVTDPTGYGWWVDSDSPYGGYENGDLCAWYWAGDGSDYIGLSDNSSDVTNVINGHPYFTQGEWSNNDATSTGESGCVWGYNSSTPDFTPGTTTLTGGPQASPGGVLTLTAGEYTGNAVYSYIWVRCSPDARRSCTAVGRARQELRARPGLQHGAVPRLEHVLERRQQRHLHGDEPRTSDTTSTAWCWATTARVTRTASSPTTARTSPAWPSPASRSTRSRRASARTATSCPAPR